jgi:hypothetical protein
MVKLRKMTAMALMAYVLAHHQDRGDQGKARLTICTRESKVIVSCRIVIDNHLNQVKQAVVRSQWMMES